MAAESETVPTKPPEPLIVMVSLVLLPGATETVGVDGASVKPGGALTVRAIVVEAVRLPDVPVTVTVEVPVADMLLAASVRTLEPTAGFVAKVAVTPLGSPVAASVTLPLNPLLPLTVMVSVALFP